MNKPRRFKEAESTESIEREKPDTIVLIDKLSSRIGSIASVLALTVLLGGFVSSLGSYDFWVISALTLSSTLRIFGGAQEAKLNPRRTLKRHVLLRYVLDLLRGRKQFHIMGGTVIAGALDLIMYLLQLLSASISLGFSLHRLLHHADFVPDDGSKNQRDAMVLYYSMVLAEALLFLPAKLCWEFPRSWFLRKEVLFSLTTDRDRMGKIFKVFEDYFAKVYEAARESVTKGLDMSLRSYIAAARHGK